MLNKIVIICGMPRSGTSWLGQLFNSNENVAFRMEPLFSYTFKNAISAKSSVKDIILFFKNVYDTNDGFILQEENQLKGNYPFFYKNNTQDVMVIKTTRHHELLNYYLESIKDIVVISIVRHPCAVINSWAKSYNEFQKKGCSLERDWRTGGCRKDGVGEYWGFNDWITVTNLHLKLSNEYDNFYIVRYSDLVVDTYKTMAYLFDKVNLEITNQALQFIDSCHKTHSQDPYSVFKDKKVKNKWIDELPRNIAMEIIENVKSEGLMEFL